MSLYKSVILPTLLMLFIANPAFATLFTLNNVVTTNGVLLGYFELNQGSGGSVNVGNYIITAVNNGSVMFGWSSNPLFPYPSITSASRDGTGLVDVFWRESLPLGANDNAHSVTLEIAFNEHDFNALSGSIPLIPSTIGELGTSNWYEIHLDHDYGAYGNVISGSVLVSEPSTIALLSLGFVGLQVLRRSSGKSKSMQL